MIDFSAKQKEVWGNTIKQHHRWNISTGATRSGKTYLDYYKIPHRIRTAGDDGLILLLGNTQGTLERNILEPMRSIWTEALVGNIVRGDNTVNLFGRKCYALGADKITQVHKLQGVGLGYAYGDEITTWNPDVFQMLKSRLDKPGACFDGTCNPEGPNHWFKAFLDSDADVYIMPFRLDDNPFLDKTFVDNLKAEYTGTVYYDRWIEGRWKAAEGLIYRQVADNPSDYIIARKDIKTPDFITIGGDVGGNRALSTFVATGFFDGFKTAVALLDHDIKGKKGDIDSERFNVEFQGFTERLMAAYPNVPIRYTFIDNEAQYILNGLANHVKRNGIPTKVAGAAKIRIKDRIICANTLLNTGRMFISDDCTLLLEGLQNALWDPKAAAKGEDKRLDDFTSNIDILDGWEYSWERLIGKLLPNYSGGKDED